METFPFKKAIIALVVIMAIIAGVWVFLLPEESPPPATTQTTLTIAVNGSGTTSPAVGEHEYSEGEAVSITATPDSGWQFDSWDGDVANPNSATTTVTMDANKTITANFSEAPVTTPQMTPEEQTYAITIATHTTILNQALSPLSLLMANPQIGDTQWTTDVVVQLSVIQALYDEAIAIDPPSSMAHIHDKYVQAMEHYNTAIQLITQGIEEVNVNLIEEQAIVDMNTGSQLLAEAIELLNEFTEAHST